MTSPPPHITVLGSLNIDLVSYVPHHPQPGETLTSNSFAVSPGGKGANQAAACAKLSRTRTRSSPPSANIAMLGAVGGRDPYGETLLDALKAVDVDVGGVSHRQDAQTGVAVIIVDEPTGQNRIVLSPGANYSLRPEDFSRPESLGRTDLLVMQLEIPLVTVVAAIKTAHAAGIPVLLNAAPAPSPADADALAAVFPQLAHLVVNEVEAAALCGVPVSDLDEVAGLERAGAWFIERGIKSVVMTLGERGAFWMTGSESKGLVPAAKVKEVVDTTAAGDTFVGVYCLQVVAQKAQRFDVEGAVKAATVASAKTVERKGAQDSIPWADELDR